MFRKSSRSFPLFTVKHTNKNHRVEIKTDSYLKMIKFLANVSNRQIMMNTGRKIFNQIFAQKKKKIYKERRLLGYTQEQLFNVVYDVEKYSEFVPWCTQSTIIKEFDSGVRLCTLGVGFPPLNESYTSRVSGKPFTSVRSVASNSSIFKHLVNQWHFKPGLPDNHRTCYIEFEVDFEFKNVIHSHLSQLFFDQVVKLMVNAFLNRAGKIYGPESIKRQKPQIITYVNR